MQNKYELKITELKAKYNKNEINYDGNEYVENTTNLIFGQERGTSAFLFGLDIENKGYNIFIESPTGVGKMKYINNYLKEKVKEKERELFDYVYVNNFMREDEPISIVLKKGDAVKFKNDMKQYISYIKENLSKSFKDDELSNKKKVAEESLELRKKKLVEDLNITTKPMGFEIVEGAKGVFMLPVKNGKTLSKEEYEKLPQKEKVEYERKSPQIQEKIFEVLTKIRGFEIEKEREMSTWKTTVASATLNVATKYLEEKYSDNDKIVEYICNVKKDILQNINEFLESSHEEVEDKRKMPGMVQKENIMERYNVNIFVDNSRTETVPLVMDVDYSFENIFRKSRV